MTRSGTDQSWQRLREHFYAIYDLTDPILRAIFFGFFWRLGSLCAQQAFVFQVFLHVSKNLLFCNVFWLISIYGCRQRWAPNGALLLTHAAKSLQNTTNSTHDLAKRCKRTPAGRKHTKSNAKTAHRQHNNSTPAHQHTSTPAQQQHNNSPRTAQQQHKMAAEKRSSTRATHEQHDDFNA